MPKQSLLKGILVPALFTLIAGAVLVSLGVWQLHRLAWKEELIAAIDSRADATPVSLPSPEQWPRLKPDDYDYRHVEARGHFEYDKEALVFRGAGPEGEGPGYLVLTPLRRDDGTIVIVNRGYVPERLKDPAQRQQGQVAGEVRVTGLMRPPEPRNFFTPADEPERNVYFTRDPNAIAKHLGLMNVAPFTIDADPSAVPGGWPKGGTTVRNIPNNHLGYAITWFGLAIALAGVFASFVVRRLTGEGAQTSAPEL